MIVSLPITAEASLHLAVPDGAIEEPEAAQPVIDVSRLPGAAIALRRGFQAKEGISMRALCVTAPSDRWAPGVEDLVLERATGLLRGALGGEVTRLDLGAIDRSSPRFEQRFEGAVTRSGVPFAFQGRHLLGFTGERRTAVLCSVVCAEPGEKAVACTGLVAQQEAEGAWTSAPPPSLAIQAILFTAARPEVALGVAAALAFGVIALVLWRRPRPRW
ncbi:MAG: hypothetical protein U0359_30225 [Byssovorax sp.]